MVVSYLVADKDVAQVESLWLLVSLKTSLYSDAPAAHTAAVEAPVTVIGKPENFSTVIGKPENLSTVIGKPENLSMVTGKP